MPALPWKEFQAVDPVRQYAAMASRLPLRAHRSVPGFLLDAMRIRRPAGARAWPGRLRPRPPEVRPARTFWTISVWADEQSLSKFAAADPHRALTKELQPHMGPSHFEFFPICGGDLPLDWDEVRAAAGDGRESNETRAFYRTDPWFPRPRSARSRHSGNLTRVNSSSPGCGGGASTWQLGDLTVNRLGFGAMRLTGSQPFSKGSPSDPRASRSPCCAARSSSASATSTRPRSTSRPSGRPTS